MFGIVKPLTAGSVMALGLRARTHGHLEDVGRQAPAQPDSLRAPRPGEVACGHEPPLVTCDCFRFSNSASQPRSSALADPRPTATAQATPSEPKAIKHEP